MSEQQKQSTELTEANFESLVNTINTSMNRLLDMLDKAQNAAIERGNQLIAANVQILRLNEKLIELQEKLLQQDQGDESIHHHTRGGDLG